MKNTYIVKYKSNLRQDAVVCASDKAEASREGIATLRYHFSGRLDWNDDDILSVELAPEGTATGTRTSRACCEYETDSPEWRRFHDGTTSAILAQCKKAR